MSIRKNHKIGCAFLSRAGDSLAKSFRSGIRATIERASALARQEQCKPLNYFLESLISGMKGSAL